MNIEKKLRFLEEQIIILNQDNEEIAELMVTKIIPMYKEYVRFKDRERELLVAYARCPRCGYTMNFDVKQNICFCTNHDCNYFEHSVRLKDLQSRVGGVR